MSTQLPGAPLALDDAEYRSGLRRIKARADEARDRLEAAGAGVDASEPPSDVWKKLEEGGKYISDQTWNLVPRRVMQRVEVGDETLLLVPTLGEPVEWQRSIFARGTKTRRARRDLVTDGVVPMNGSPEELKAATETPRT